MQYNSAVSPLRSLMVTLPLISCLDPSACVQLKLPSFLFSQIMSLSTYSTGKKKETVTYKKYYLILHELFFLFGNLYQIPEETTKDGKSTFKKTAFKFYALKIINFCQVLNNPTTNIDGVSSNWCGSAGQGSRGVLGGWRWFHSHSELHMLPLSLIFGLDPWIKG